ncbi:MAG TPA: hypothetical protein VGW77_30780 [Candidatus Binatia bacterium]|jgi:hypothetical protein|nr:hypothetical protein [Candidatus Binatia bacterium]
MNKTILNLGDNFILNFCLLFLILLTINIAGPRVPSGNEFTYLVHLMKQWHPNYLAHDWTYAGTLPSHFIFNYLFGALTMLMAVETVGWVGRVLTWGLVLFAFFKFGEKFPISRWMVTVSILLWMLYRQSAFMSDWILASFEAKCVAYIFLLFALVGIVNRRELSSALFLGLSFSFHPVVGLWGSAAVGLSLLCLRYPFGTLVKMGCWVILGALPGILSTMTMVSGNYSITAAQAKLTTLVWSPYELDPFYREKKLDIFVATLFWFNWLQYRSDKDNQAVRFFFYFQASLGLVFVSGFLARYLELYKYLIWMPMRLFPLFVLLFFFYSLMKACVQVYNTHRLSPWLIGVGIFALLSFPNPVDRLAVELQNNYAAWNGQTDDVQKSLKWLAKNTPVDSVIISPPWRKESFYLSERAQVANWWGPRFDRFDEWRERIESMLGDMTVKRGLKSYEEYYNHLRQVDIESIRKKYGGEYLVSAGSYTYPVVYQSGECKVYALSRSQT